MTIHIMYYLYPQWPNHIQYKRYEMYTHSNSNYKKLLNQTTPCYNFKTERTEKKTRTKSCTIALFVNGNMEI